MIPKVSIVVLNYNRPKDTIECLDFLKKINYPNFEIIVVDNHSRDDSCQQIREKFPEVMIIENQENYGYAQGNNIGIRKAIGLSSDYIMILNNDTIVEKEFLSLLVNEMEKDPSVAVAGPLILYYDDENIIQSAGGTISFWRPRYLSQYRSVGDSLEMTNSVGYLSGCCILLRTGYLSKIGLFDPDFFLFCEEVDLCIRARKAGLNLLFVPQAKIWHKVSITAGGEYSPLAKYYGIRNRLLLLNKHGSNFDKIMFFMIIIPLTVVKNFFVLIGRPESLLAFFRGLADGLRGRFGKR